MDMLNDNQITIIDYQTQSCYHSLIPQLKFLTWPWQYQHCLHCGLWQNIFTV